MLTLDQFRQRCREQGVPVTRQREILYESLLALPGHPTLEDLYRAARRKDPSLSLATVYNTVRRLLEVGLLRELSPVHGGMRIEANAAPHHHLICTRCQSVRDLGEAEIEPARLKGDFAGFTVQRVSVDVLGLCAECQAVPIER